MQYLNDNLEKMDTQSELRAALTYITSIGNAKTTDKVFEFLSRGKSSIDKNCANVVENKIDAIGTVTLDSNGLIATARSAYDTLSDRPERREVSTYKILAAAETAYAEKVAFKKAITVGKTSIKSLKKGHRGFHRKVEDDLWRYRISTYVLQDKEL